MSSSQPNLLFIMTDQQRGDCLGCDGHPVVQTPYLDELAEQGTRFCHAYSASPSCIPSRATLLTGQDQWTTGILGMGKGQTSIRTDYQHTLPGELAKAGYHTQAIGKNHFTPDRALNGYHNCILDESSRLDDSDYLRWFQENKTGPYSHRDHSVGWNSWMARPSHLPEHLHPTHWTAQQAMNWLDRRDPEKPFFLKVSFARPHSPYEPPQSYWDMYADADIPEASVGEWANEHDERVDKTDAWRSKRPAVDIRRARQGYYGSVSFIDHQIGRLFYHMQKTCPEAYANTLIIFLSDHGDMLGDHHLWRKTYAYEGSARVPMIVRPPMTWDVPRGQVRQEVVELRDLMPTMLEAAGVSIPDTVTGQSMLPLSQGKNVSWRDYLQGEHVWCYSHEQANMYMTDGREKYIWFPYLGKEQYFDLTTDPRELNDRSGDGAYESKVTALRQRLIGILEARGCGCAVDGKLRTLGLDELITSPNA